MSIDYRRRPARAEDVFRLIAKAPTGRALLEAFVPLLARKRVAIVPYPPELVAKLRETIPAGHPIGACFVVDPASGTGTIHLDFESPVGVLAPFLVHEIVHALDPRVWKGETRSAGRTRF